LLFFFFPSDNSPLFVVRQRPPFQVYSVLSSPFFFFFFPPPTKASFFLAFFGVPPHFSPVRKPLPPFTSKRIRGVFQRKPFSLFFQRQQCCFSRKTPPLLPLLQGPFAFPPSPRICTVDVPQGGRTVLFPSSVRILISPAPPVLPPFFFWWPTSFSPPWLLDRFFPEEVANPLFFPFAIPTILLLGGAPPPSLFGNVSFFRTVKVALLMQIYSPPFPLFRSGWVLRTLPCRSPPLWALDSPSSFFPPLMNESCGFSFLSLFCFPGPYGFPPPFLFFFPCIPFHSLMAGRFFFPGRSPFPEQIIIPATFFLFSLPSSFTFKGIEASPLREIGAFFPGTDLLQFTP